MQHYVEGQHPASERSVVEGDPVMGRLTMTGEERFLSSELRRLWLRPSESELLASLRSLRA